MDSLLQNVADLPAPARSAVEGLIGHALRDDQQLYIVALDAAAEPEAHQRHQAWAELQEIIGESHAAVRKTGVSSDELDAIIDESCDEVRYGK